MTALPRCSVFVSPAPRYLQEVDAEPITIALYGFGGSAETEQALTIPEAERLRQQLDAVLERVARHDPGAEPGRMR